MRLGGPITHVSDVTATTPMLSQLGMLSPEVLMQIHTLFEGQESGLSSLLTKRGMFVKGKYAGMQNSGNFHVLGNRKVKWALKGLPFRKGNIVSHTGGNTPGLNGAMFDIVLNTDFFSVNDDLELVDRRTLLHVQAKNVQMTGSTTTYTVSLKYNQQGSYCDPTLLTTGYEIGFGHTSFPEASEDAGEKNTTYEWHTEWMGIRRMKYTISGSAANQKMWITHNGQRIWDYVQNIDMFKRWSQMTEHANIFGQATVDANDNVYLKDLSGRDIIDGNGLLAQGDAGLKWQYNRLSIDTIEDVLSNMADLSADAEGNVSVACLCGPDFYLDFNRLMRDVFRMNPEPLFVSGPDGNKVSTNFKYYQMGNYKIEFIQSNFWNAPWRPTLRGSDGRSTNNGDAIFVNLGNTPGGDPNVMLTTIGNGEEDRSFVHRIINGMTGKGAPVKDGATGMVEMAASPVDAKQVHVLCESGIVLKNPFGVAELRKARRR